MCLAANLPLVESGTAGYLGQVTVIRKVRILGAGHCHKKGKDIWGRSLL